eukprot:TRINITY_DN4843_c0_g1_i12.p1 TRINITY_DN4843_c0_g1~~TRINITY_DN4843_c0_g1_i12.p1  ORF type:complete len:155 (+),score=12.92 TRINITY_DN4843_c0_g1_i12:84-548(+)
MFFYELEWSWIEWYLWKCWRWLTNSLWRSCPVIRAESVSLEQSDQHWNLWKLWSWLAIVLSISSEVNLFEWEWSWNDNAFVDFWESNDLWSLWKLWCCLSILFVSAKVKLFEWEWSWNVVCPFFLFLPKLNFSNGNGLGTVSYTHLTLPTIYSV